MEVTVIKTFIDKDTNIRMECGMKADYEESRAKELIKKGFVEKIKEKVIEEVVEEEKPAKKSKKKSK